MAFCTFKLRYDFEQVNTDPNNATAVPALHLLLEVSSLKQPECNGGMQTRWRHTLGTTRIESTIQLLRLT
jgi:hypothetical protein